TSHSFCRTPHPPVHSPDRTARGYSEKPPARRWFPPPSRENNSTGRRRKRRWHLQTPRLESLDCGRRRECKPLSPNARSHTPSEPAHSPHQRTRDRRSWQPRLSAASRQTREEGQGTKKQRLGTLHPAQAARPQGAQHKKGNQKER